MVTTENILRAGAGLRLDLDPDGQVKSLAAGKKALSLSGPGGFSVQEVLPPDGRVSKPECVTGSVRHKGRALRFEGRAPQANLELSATFRGGKFIDVRGEVRDLTGKDRAVTVTFTLPLRLAGWRWENTPFTARAIQPGKVYPSAHKDVLYLDRRGEGFLNEDHAPYTIPINKLPFSAVCRGKSGLALAYPLHEPRVFMIRASAEGYSITFSLGLTPETRNFPGKASFRFVIYGVDSAWGIRSAAERYYEFFPELFASRARRHGNFGVYLRARTEGAEDFGVVYTDEDFQWRNGEMSPEGAAEARRLKHEVFHWRGPWYWFHEGPADFPLDEELALLKAQTEGRAQGAHGKNNQLCGCPHEISAQGGYNSAVLDERGRLSRIFYPPGYGCWLLPMNMNPDLPKPNRASLATDWQFRYLSRWKDPNFRGPRNFAWDAEDDWGGFRRLNFRREHFACEPVPLTFDPTTGRLCQVNGFSHWAFARMHSRTVRKAGGLIMCNVNLEQSAMFVGQFIDVFVKERRAKDSDDERLWVFRALAGKKPVSFLGSWQPKGGRALEATICRLLLLGLAPGSSNLESQRALHKKYLPVFSEMAAAGWQPVTHAEAKGLCVERFGAAPGSLFLAVGNRGGRKVAGRVALDLRALGLSGRAVGLQVSEILQGRGVRTVRRNGRLLASVSVGPRETVVLAVHGGRQ